MIFFYHQVITNLQYYFDFCLNLKQNECQNFNFHNCLFDQDFIYINKGQYFQYHLFNLNMYTGYFINKVLRYYLILLNNLIIYLQCHINYIDNQLMILPFYKIFFSMKYFSIFNFFLLKMIYLLKDEFQDNFNLNDANLCKYNNDCLKLI